MCEQNTNKRHKWADVLIAIAEGRDVQWKTTDGKQWTDIEAHSALTCFGNISIEWRVKPKIVRKYTYAYKAVGQDIMTTSVVYKDDQHFCSIASKGSLTIEWFQRLENSCVESEES